MVVLVLEQQILVQMLQAVEAVLVLLVQMA
jgi:hypothetical protein